MSCPRRYGCTIKRKMIVDKDKPSTWVKYKQSMCRDCIGTCCTMPVEIKIEDLLKLGRISEDDLHESRRKLVNRLKKEGLVQSYRESTQLFMLTAKPNGDCYFLDSKTRLCTAYENRPNVCRNFPTSMGNRLGFCPQIKK
jgi:Fe-S-cluster containining protein